ncbi:MAG: pyridoxamine 5'-phosphate oxidase [Propioniciclava sp.]
MDIAGMRRSYDAHELTERDAPEVPLELFERWFAEAAAVGGFEPNAMTVATADVHGRPSARTILLKGYGSDGLVWFTHDTSRKGRELETNPWAALLFFWAPLERQVRVEGPVARVSPEESDAYFASRPLGSRLGAWASSQSAVIASREVLEDAADAAASEHGTDPGRPPGWGGYRLAPEVWEFWQGRPSRLHDRIRYRADGQHWVRDRLAP